MERDESDGVLPEGAQIAGKYVLRRVIGKGGMGIVYAAEHVSLRQRVAIKFLLPEAMKLPEASERFVREARAAAALQSEHVARVIDVGTTENGTPYMVMEHLTGTDLRRLLRARGPLPIDEAVDYVLQACEAMAEAHALGFVHRDLKPANIFLADRVSGVPIVKVLDFGLSKSLRVNDDAENSLTTDDAVMGSFHYMAPEQVRGMKHADARTDIWALGVILYQLITGHRPFEADTLAEAVVRAAQDAPTPASQWLSDIPPELEAILVRCIASDREQRPQSISELAQALEPFGSRSGVGSVDRILHSQGIPRSAASARRRASSNPLQPPASQPAAMQEARGADSAPGPRSQSSPTLLAGSTTSRAGSLPLSANSRTSQHASSPRVPVMVAEWPPGAPLRQSAAPPSNGAPPSSMGASSTTSPSGMPTVPASSGFGAQHQKRAWRWGAALLGVAAAVGIGSWAVPRALPSLADAKAMSIDAERLASFHPLPERSLQHGISPVTEARVRLGKRLFYEPQLSKSGTMSCNTCHPLDRYGSDGRKTSIGVDNRELPRNTPSVYNASSYFALMWDGRHDTLVQQAKGVLTSPQEMAMSEETVLAVLKASPSYAEAFAKAFSGEKEPLSFETTVKAIAEFESMLFTRGRWDKFLEGDRSALSDEEKQGFNLFVDVGCVSCHFGPNVGAMMFQKLGLVKAWPDSRDRGRYEVTKRNLDWMVFRVPSLRNVAMTAPYFHDGSIATLEEAVRMMARHQIGRELDDTQVRHIVSWLKSLTGEIPTELITPDPPSPKGEHAAAEPTPANVPAATSAAVPPPAPTRARSPSVPAVGAPTGKTP